MLEIVAFELFTQQWQGLNLAKAGVQVFQLPGASNAEQLFDGRASCFGDVNEEQAVMTIYGH